MTNILIRDVPDEVHQELLRRAGRSGRSLQQYLSAEPSRLAETPAMDDILARIGTRRGGRVGFEDAVSDLEAARFDS